MEREWIEAPLPEVIDFQEGPGILAADFRDKGVPLVRLAGLERGGSLLTGCNYLDPEAVTKRWSRFALSEGDILLSTSGTLGRIAIVNEDCVGAIPYTGIIRMRPRDNRLLEQFIPYLLGGPIFQHQAEMVGVGGVIRHFGPFHLRQMTVRLPPPGEQRAIAEVLSDVDGLLRALGTLIAKKQAIKQATMQQLLTGKTRLPGFNGEWAEVPLEELARITMGQSPSSDFYNLVGDGLPLIQGNADLEHRRATARVWTTQASKRCDAGDLLLTVRAPVGEVGIATTDACLGRGVCGLKPVGNHVFLFQALLFAEPRWKSLEQGSTFTSANSRQIGQFTLITPRDPEEQSAVATVLSDMDVEIAALEARRDKTRAINQGIMQQLIDGRVRLVKAESSEASA